jgi:methyl-accepting chemotaxis protein
MKTTQGLSIFRKLVGIFLILTIVIGATWVASLVFFYQRNDRASTAHSFANEIDIWMLQARRNEKDFQLRDTRTAEFYEKGTGANLAQHGKSVEQMNQAIDRLQALNQVKRQSVDDLRTAVAAYEAAFEKLVAAYRERGFADWGAEGAWRVAAHGIESRLASVNRASLTISLLEVRRHEKDYLLRSDPTYVDQLTAELDKLQGGVGALGEPTRSTLLGDIESYRGAFQAYLDLQKRIGLTENEGLQGDMRDSIHKVEPLVASVVDETRKLSQSQQAFRNLLAAVFAIMVGGLGIGALMFSFFARSISAPIRRVVGLLENLARGDLQESVGKDLLGRRDEIGVLSGALDATAGKLRGMVATIQDSAQQVAASSEQISSGSRSLAESAQIQASNLEETSASMEELTASVEQVSENAQSQAAAVQQGSSAMVQVRKSIDEITGSLARISELAAASVSNAQNGSAAVRQVMESITLIAGGSERIGGIVSVIADIADQTNLLALNASIEAARAGEHGRGFAVVADEVSKLADRSSGSTKEIEGLIRESARNVSKGVEIATGSQSAMEEIRGASLKVRDMIAELAGSVGQQTAAIKDLASALENVSEMSQSISAATEEQTVNAKQVSKAVESVNDHTQKSAAAAEEMSSSTVQLSAMAVDLQKTTAQFKLQAGQAEEAQLAAGAALIAAVPAQGTTGA